MKRVYFTSKAEQFYSMEMYINLGPSVSEAFEGDVGLFFDEEEVIRDLRA